MKNKKSLFLLILIFNILFFVVAAWLLPFQYEENDDITMCMIANGSFTGSPDCHLVFINAIYGCLLVLLYNFIGVVEWYTISFSILHIISITVIVYIILTENESKGVVKSIFLVFFYVVWIRLILYFQFTTTAGLTCFAGCVLLSRKTKFAYILGLILVVTASLVRFAAAGLVVLLYIPVFINDIGLKFRSYIPLAFVLLVVLLFKVSDSFFYKTQGWREYRQFNEIRGKINDNPNAANIDLSKLPKDVDEDEYIMLLYCLSDPSILTVDVMRQLNQVIQKTPFVDKVKNVKNLRKYFMVVLVLTIGFVASFITKEKKKVLFGIICWLLGFFVLIAIAMDGTLKYRVFFCYLMPMMWILYLSIRKVNRIDAFVAVTLMSSLLISTKYAKMNVRIREGCKSFREEVFQKFQYSLLEEYTKIKGDAESKMCFWNLSVECLNPMKIMDSKINTLGYGWTANMPVSNALKSHLDFIKDDVVIFAYKDEDGENTFVFNKLQDCILRNYGVATKTVIVCENDKYQIVKFLVSCEEK